jgi:hypothetical protein
MGNRFASGRHSISECDRCGFRFKLTELCPEVVKGRTISNLVCNACWSQDHPQLMLGTFPIDDPQAVHNPRPDRSYGASGLLANGSPGGGSRSIQWGWAPVGGSSFFNAALTPNRLALRAQVGTVEVQTI